MNPLQIISNMMRGSANPQSMIMNMLQQNMNSNPIMGNVYNMAQKNDFKGIEQMARNLCKEKGINVDDAINQIKQQLGM